MQVKPSRPAIESKTIQAADKSDRLQTYFVIGAALISVSWFCLGVYSLELQKRVSGLAVPALLALSTGAKIGAKFYNKAVKDGRLDVGDVWTLAGEFGPNPDEVAAHVLLNSIEEFERFESMCDFIQHGTNANEEMEEIKKPSHFSINL